MARYACLKVERDHVVINNKKTGVKRQWKKNRIRSVKTGKSMTYELPETKRSPGNAKPDRSSERFLPVVS
mgnify:CR=1 FL=1